MLSRAPLGLAVALLLAALPAAVPAFGQGIPGTIVTGPAASSAQRLGQDIAGLATACGLTLEARPSEGSLENMQAVRDRRYTQLGIVQGDALEYYQTFQDDDPSLRRPAQGIRVVMPLPDAAIHVLARQDIARLADLSGRRIATGTPGSGTRLTADLVLDLAAVGPAERIAMAPDAALAALRAGEVDAAFIVDAAPSGLLAGMDAAGLHLLPITEPALTAAYAPTKIPAGTYPFAPEETSTVSVQTLLVAFGFDPAANAYQAASCRLVSDVSHLILSRLDGLRIEGHPGWGTVDLTALPAGAEVSACALAGVDPGYAFTCRRPDGTTTTEDAAATTDGNALFVQRICARLGC